MASHNNPFMNNKSTGIDLFSLINSTQTKTQSNNYNNIITKSIVQTKNNQNILQLFQKSNSINIFSSTIKKDLPNQQFQLQGSHKINGNNKNSQIIHTQCNTSKKLKANIQICLGKEKSINQISLLKTNSSNPEQLFELKNCLQFESKYIGAKILECKKKAFFYNNQINQIFNYNFAQALVEIKKRPLKHPINYDVLARLYKGLSFFSYDQFREKQLGVYFNNSEHTWFNILTQIKKELQIDAVIAFYLLSNTLYKIKAIDFFPNIFQIKQKQISIKDQIVIDEVKKYFLLQKKSLIEIYYHLLSKNRPSDQKFTTKNIEINVLTSFLNYFSNYSNTFKNQRQIQYKELSQDIIKVMLQYWKKSSQQDKEIYLLKIFRQTLSKISDSTLKGRLNSILMIYDLKTGFKNQNSFGINFIKYYLDKNESELVLIEGIKQLKHIVIDKEIMYNEIIQKVKQRLQTRSIQSIYQSYPDKKYMQYLEMQFQITTILKLPIIDEKITHWIKKSLNNIYNCFPTYFYGLVLQKITNNIKNEQLFQKIQPQIKKLISRVQILNELLIVRQQSQYQQIKKQILKNTQYQSQYKMPFLQICLNLLQVIQNKIKQAQLIESLFQKRKRFKFKNQEYSIFSAILSNYVCKFHKNLQKQNKLMNMINFHLDKLQNQKRDDEGIQSYLKQSFLQISNIFEIFQCQLQINQKII